MFVGKHAQNIFFDAVNQKCYEDSLILLKEMYERDFHWEHLAVQLSQFDFFLDTIVISVTKLFESLLIFGKNQS